MCLVTAQLKPKIADKDIICYKLVKRTKIKGIYKSSFQRFEYIIRQLYTNYFDIKYADMFIKRRYNLSVIEEGIFHSYENYLSAITILPNLVVLKCIFTIKIPSSSICF